MDSKGLHHSNKSLSLDKRSNRALSIKDRKDSGYISPITPASAATSTEGAVIRRSLSSAQTQALASSSSGETSPEVIQSPVQEGQPLSLAASDMQCTVHISPQGTYQEEPISPEASSTQFPHLQQRPPPSNLNRNDIILLAFQCRTVHNDWSRCCHPYCYKIRRHWEFFRRCCADIQSCCTDCSNFKKMIVDHSTTCTDLDCPVVMCNEAKNLYQAQMEEVGENSLRRTLQRSQSFTQRTPVTENAGLEFLLSNYSQYGNDGMDSYSSLGATREMIQAKAQEIVDRLDKEEPLLTNERPRSLPQDEMHDRVIVGNALSPIVETREDLSSMNSDNYSYDHPVSLILPNSQYGSYGAYSSLGDGTGLSGSMPSLGGVSQPPSGLIIEQPAVQPVKQVVYPTQNLIHRLDNCYLVPGQDGYYYQDRDYYINDVESLGSGGFGTCMWGKDNTTEQQFAMKRNKEYSESRIDNMRAECFVLSRLKPHDNVIRFLGAVIDEEDNNVMLPKVCKMFLELADCGNLAEMLVVDQEAKILEPLPLDQALYYIEQVLQGVNYLHQNGVLHLDIKALNVLVFDGGRTVKLADFGTAVQLSEISAVGNKIEGCTPYFAAPEVVRQEQPHFSSDIWSVMCVLVELLTTKWPGCHVQSNTHQQMIYLVGCYKDTNIEKLIPLSRMNLDPEIEGLFRCVFIADSSQRPSALNLLNHPIFQEAREYAREFDCMDEEMSCDPIQEALPIPGDAAAQAAQYLHMPYTPPQAAGPVVVTSTPFTPPQASEHHSYTPSQQCYSSHDLERDHPAVYKRESRDSGRGEELESSLISRGCPHRSSTGSSGLDHRNSDSGIDTPYDASLRKRFNQWPDDSFQGTENCEDYHSFPFVDHARDPAYFKRSSSMTGGATNSNHSDSKNSMSNPPKLVPSSHRLYHSYSAPIVGDQFTRRRMSLQMSLGDKSEGEGRPRLRRTSSMVYVDKGPDIDSPDREKRASIEELISDVSGLNLDHAHSPSHSRQSQPRTTRTEPVKQQDDSATVTRHVTEPLSGGRSKTMTFFETVC